MPRYGMKYEFFTSKELRPLGWLKRQLEIEAEGLFGNLDKIWPDVRDSGWIGGRREGWERVPYWLDGFIPLAALLDDENMKARAKRYMDAILAAQQPDGWLCPCSEEERADYDPWGILLICKVLTVYYDCFRDERVPEALYRTMKNFAQLLKNGSIKLFGWGKFRWFEGFIGLNFLRRRYSDAWISELAETLKREGACYRDYMARWKRPMNQWTMETHVVNLAMMLKSEAVSCDLLGLPYTDEAEELLDVLTACNGTPTGLFTGDECLSGLSPIQGTELCAVVELMYSYELLYAFTGDPKWAERLERVAFNALPATISDDMWAHQYVQMSNQISCRKFPGKSVFRTNNSEAHLFGLEPNYGCCTANFGQGWPKLALSCFLHDGDTIESVIPIPCELNDGQRQIRLVTDYPFENTLHYEIRTDRDFRFRIRVPSFAVRLRVDGVPVDTASLCFEIPAGCERTIEVSFEVEPICEPRPNRLTAVRCGSLIFSLPIQFEEKRIEYERNGVVRKFPYCDYEYRPTSEWRYAYCDKPMTVIYRGIGDVPFSSQNPPCVLRAAVRRIDWDYEDGYDSVCAKAPSDVTPMAEAEEYLLYPYGCAKLRMTELPLLPGNGLPL